MGGSSVSPGTQFWFSDLLMWWNDALVTILKGVESLAGFNTKLTVEQQCVRLRISATCSPWWSHRDLFQCHYLTGYQNFATSCVLEAFSLAESSSDRLECSWTSTGGRRFLDHMSVGRWRRDTIYQNPDLFWFEWLWVIRYSRGAFQAKPRDSAIGKRGNSDCA